MAGKIGSWVDFQNFLDTCCQEVGANPDHSIHGRWWRDMDYATFMTTGTVKGQRIVVVGDPDNSVVIHSLRGDTPEFADSPASQWGRMPAYGTAFFKPEDVDEIADWIARGCPNGPPVPSA